MNLNVANQIEITILERAGAGKSGNKVKVKP